MDLVFEIATLLGGVTALWFLYDKRIVVIAFFKKNDASLDEVKGYYAEFSDDEFTFFGDISKYLLGGGYLPSTEHERRLCISLFNKDVLTKTRKEKYKLTTKGKQMLPTKNT